MSELSKILETFTDINAEQQGQVKATVTTAEVRGAQAACTSLLHNVRAVTFYLRLS